MSRFVLIGHPVEHSLSPPMHAAAYAELGLTHSYDVVDAPDEAAVAAVLRQVSSGEIAGANITVPWKRVALGLASRADPLAERTNAANVWLREPSGAVVAHNTDVLALVEELGRLAPRAARVSVIGSGGAALAVLVACRKLGIDEVGVVSRSYRASEPKQRWKHAAELEALGADLLPWPSPDSLEFARFARGSQVIVQATSAGMTGGDPGELVRDIVPFAELDHDTLAYDVVYTPRVTPFLAAAARHGLRAEGGLGMLVAQAALAFELWLEKAPSRRVMREAAEKVLASKERR